MDIKNIIDNYFEHFNAGELKRAAIAYKKHIENGGKMMITLAGAMSTAGIGKLLAPIIRKGYVHAISCTGANLEEDVFRLVALSHYKKIPNYKELSSKQEEDLYNQGFNRVTDICIPEEEAFRKIEKALVKEWNAAENAANEFPFTVESYFPHEYLQSILTPEFLLENIEGDYHDSWVLAAKAYNIPIFVPGWEDSTLGNIFASYCIAGKIRSHIMSTGIEYMVELAKWYTETSKESSIGFFQIGGGIAGDFPICVVPMINQDLQANVPLWGYFCQISDSTTSYGSYSGAVPNEKITWGKLSKDTPKFMIESDASIVAPLIFAYLLDI